MPSSTAGSVLRAAVPLLLSLSLCFVRRAAASAASSYCWNKDYRWVPSDDGDFGSDATLGSTLTANAMSCHRQCNAISNCSRYSFSHDSGTCYIMGIHTFPTYDAGAISGGAGTNTVSDSCFLDSCSPRDGLVGSFPGLSAEAAHSAFPGGYQPMPLECWPKTSDGGYQPCALNSVLFDTGQGWAGTCLGLTEVIPNQNQTCQSQCLANPLCPGWQMTTAGECWLGLGYHCELLERIDQVEIAQAQRVQYGGVRVLANITGFRVLGLKQVFDQDYYGSRYVPAARACKYACYSLIQCQYWQLIEDSGCWVEDASAGFGVPYPLLSSSVQGLNESGVHAGEFVQHYCEAPLSSAPPDDVAPAPSTPSAPSAAPPALTTRPPAAVPTAVLAPARPAPTGVPMPIVAGVTGAL